MVQWIELRFPEPSVQVRFLVGARGNTVKGCVHVLFGPSKYNPDGKVMEEDRP